MKKYLLAVFWILLLAGTGWAIPPMPGGTGTGDMLKATYDADGDNFIDGDKVESPTPQTAACTGAALDLQPTVKLMSSTIIVTATEACTVTMKEASNQTGQVVTIVNGSAAGIGLLTFTDQSATLELKHGSPAVLDRHHSITLVYKTDRWVEIARVPISGTPSETLQLDNDNSGPKSKNNAGVWEFRNAADNDYAAIKALSVTVKKTSGTAGASCVYTSSTTDEYGICEEGPDDHRTANLYLKYPDGSPAENVIRVQAAAAGGRSTSSWYAVKTSLAENSDTNIATQKAVKTAVDAKISASSEDTLTNKTFDASGTGNVLKQVKELIFTAPKSCDETGALMDTTKTNATFGLCKFSNSADKAGNYADYIATVPFDINTAVDLTIKAFHVGLSDVDTGAQAYEISMCNPAASAAWNCSPGNAIAVTVSADASGASGDVEYAASLPITLTDWKGAVTAGRFWKIRVARDGDAAGDGSTVDSYVLGFTISYGSTQ